MNFTSHASSAVSQQLPPFSYTAYTIDMAEQSTGRLIVHRCSAFRSTCNLCSFPFQD